MTLKRFRHQQLPNDQVLRRPLEPAFNSIGGGLPEGCSEQVGESRRIIYRHLNGPGPSRPTPVRARRIHFQQILP